MYTCVRAHMVGRARARIFLLEEALVQYRLKVDFNDFQCSRNVQLSYVYHSNHVSLAYFIRRNIYIRVVICARILSRDEKIQLELNKNKRNIRNSFVY